MAAGDPATEGYVDTAVATALAATAHVEDTILAVPLPFIAVSATISSPILTAVAPIIIKQLAVVQINPAIAVHATNNWTFTFKRWRAGVALTIVTKSTSTEGIGQRTDWNLNSIPFDSGAQELLAGDVLDLTITKGGTVANLAQPVVTVRYERL